MATVLVRGVADGTTHESLRAACAEVFGPVRRADVIRGRGFAFVHFVDADDARAAVAASRGRGVLVDGARVTIDLARPKKKTTTAPPPRGGAAAAAAPVVDPEKKKRTDALEERKEEEDHATRVRVFGLPEATTAKQLYKRLRKLPGFSELLDAPTAARPPTKTPRPLGATAVAAFVDQRRAVAAVKRLDGATVKGARTRARLEAAVAKPPERLIVRNVPFAATEDDLAAPLLRFGPLRDVHVVRTNADDTESRGFGFVEFECRADGAAALKAARAQFHTVLGRDVALDRAVGRAEYVESQRHRAAASTAAAADDDAARRDDDDDAVAAAAPGDAVSDDDGGGTDRSLLGGDDDDDDGDDDDDDESDADGDDESDGAETHKDPRGDAKEGRTLRVAVWPLSRGGASDE
mmetsp:Transcript_26534/g.106231  ORF Transcript_26534/g.106231 Transcript_26534/m.106231 type:complete len:408 (+) Transcript_26534:120-1343(+)